MSITKRSIITKGLALLLSFVLMYSTLVTSLMTAQAADNGNTEATTIYVLSDYSDEMYLYYWNSNTSGYSEATSCLKDSDGKLYLRTYEIGDKLNGIILNKSNSSINNDTKIYSNDINLDSSYSEHFITYVDGNLSYEEFKDISLINELTSSYTTDVGTQIEIANISSLSFSGSLAAYGITIELYENDSVVTQEDSSYIKYSPSSAGEHTLVLRVKDSFGQSYDLQTITVNALCDRPGFTFSAQKVETEYTEDGELDLQQTTTVYDNTVYTSSNTDVAVINGGKLIIKGIGETTVTAECDAADIYKASSASYTVEVTKGNLNGNITFLKQNPEDITYGNDLENPATYYVDGVAVEEITSQIKYAVYDVENGVTTENSTIAEISTDGILTPLKSGEVEVKAYIESDLYNTISATYRVTIEKANRTDLNFERESVYELQYGATYTNVIQNLQKSDQVTYSSSDNNYVTIDSSTGEITGVNVTGDKTVTITAVVAETDSYNETALTYEVKVVPCDISASFDKEDDEVTYEDNLTYVNYSLTYENVQNPEITYSLDSAKSLEEDDLDASSFTIDEATGEINITRSGIFKIKAEVSGGGNYNSATAYYTLTVSKAENSAFEVTTESKTVEVFKEYSLEYKAGLSSGKVSFSSANESSVTVNDSGVVTVNCYSEKVSVTITVAADEKYQEAVGTVEITPERCTRNWKFEDEFSDSVYYGQEYSAKTPSYDSGDTEFAADISYSVDDSDIAIAEFQSADSPVLTVKGNGSVTVTVTIAENDYYSEASASYTLNIKYLDLTDIGADLYTVSGTEVDNVDNAFNGDVTISVDGSYLISYAVDDYNSADWQTSITIDDNIENPEFIFKYIGSDSTAVNAVSDTVAVKLTIDKTAPTGTVKISENSIWENLLENITFGIFSSEPQTFEVTASDNTSEAFESDNIKIYYYISYDNQNSLTKDDLALISDSDWNEYVNNTTLENNHFAVVYVKLVDNYGNTSYISTNGMVSENKEPNFNVDYGNDTGNDNGYYYDDVNVCISELTDEFDGYVSSGIDRLTYEVYTVSTESNNLVLSGSLFDSENPDTDYCFKISLEDVKNNTVFFKITAMDKCGNTYIYTSEGFRMSDKPKVSVSQSSTNVGTTGDGYSIFNAEAEYQFKFTCTDSYVFDNEKALKSINDYMHSSSVGDDSYTIIEPENSDDSTYTVCIKDGKYSLESTISYDGFEFEVNGISNNIIVDTTAPKVEISFDNNSCYNKTKYFNAARTATLTVTDENFVGTNAMISVTANDYCGNSIENLPEVKWDGNTGTVEFSADANYEFNINKAEFKDIAGNEIDSSGISYANDAVYCNEFTVDTTSPENMYISYIDGNEKTLWEGLLEALSSLTGNLYSNTETVTVNFSVTDATSGIDKFECYTTDSAGNKNSDSEKTISADLAKYDSENNIYSGSYEVDSKFKGFVSITAYDKAGNSITNENEDNNPLLVVNSENPTVTINYDAPIYTENSIKYYQGSFTATVTINEFDFDANNARVTETVGGVDYTYPNSELNWEKDDNGKYFAVITLADREDKEGEVSLKVEYKNSVGEEVSATIENIIVDKTAPEIDVSYDNNEAAYDNYYNDGRTLTFKVTDDNFEFDSDMVTVTAKDKNGNSIVSVPSVNWNSDEMTGTVEFTEDAYYTFDFNDVMDKSRNSANVSYGDGTTNQNEFVIDKTAPTGTLTLKNGDNFNKEYSEEANDTEFDTYFNKSLEVSLECDDELTDCTAEYYISSKVEKDITQISDWKKYTESITKKPDCQFVVYVKLTDSANNVTYISSDAIILDETAPDIDGVDPEIKLNVNSDTATEYGYYNGDVIIDYTISDSKNSEVFSGLNEDTLTYVVTSDEDCKTVTQEGKLTELADCTIKYDSNNHISSISGTIVIDSEKNNSNNVKLTVSAKDNADNEKSVSQVFKIDITKPVISVSYDNNTSDEYNKEYFTEARKATIEIDELNFNGEDVKITVKKNDETVDLSSLVWTDEEDSNIHSAQIDFLDDADYRFDISYSDMAGNENESINYNDSVSPNSFTIDKNDPVVTLTYDNDNAVNDTYYAEQRTATISINEHNFDSSRVDCNIEVMDANSKVEAPVLSAWETDESNPDVHYATIEYTEDAEYSFTFNYSDKSGRKCDEITDSFTVDKTDPSEISIEYSTDNNIWNQFADLVNSLFGGFFYFDKNITVKITVTDETSGIDYIQYKAELDETAGVGANGIAETKVNREDLKTDDEHTFTAEFSVPAEFKGAVSAYAKDMAGNEISYDDSEKIAVSTKKPEITLTLEKDGVNRNGISYYSDDVKVIVQIEDVNFDSSLVSFTDKTVLNGTESTEKTKGNDKAYTWTNKNGTNIYSTEVTLTGTDGDKTFTAEYTNPSGISAESKVVTNITIDKTAPQVVISYDNNDCKADGYYFAASRTATIKITDDYFSGTDDMFIITKVDKSGKAISDTNMISWSKDGKTGTIKYLDDAYYTFEINTGAFVDFAKNKAVVTYANGTEAQNDFCVDTTVPTGKIYIRDTLGNKIGNDNKKYVYDETFDTYCNKTVTVTVESNDNLTYDSNLSVEYYVSTKIMTKSELLAVTDWKEYKGSLNYSPDRKLVVYARITDNSKNYIFLSTDSIILDKTAPDIDGIAPEIELNVNSKQPSVDLNENKLYYDDVIIDYVITDPILENTCSGLDEDTLKYQVLTDDVVTQSGTLSGAKTNYDGHLYTISGTITVDAELNNSNNVKVIVSAKDNAVNSSSSEKSLMIDITKPVISVSYDNNTPDSDNTKYFKANRTATISIQERNFNSDKVNLIVTEDEQEEDYSLTWSHSGAAGTDSYTHTATVTFSNDADYTFDVRYSDEATNSADAVDYGSSVSPTEFTIDKINPDITIAYDNENAQNINYYNKERIATITIDEHNFDPSRVEYTVEATNDGQEVTAPTLSSWSNSGDIHTATISYTADAKYVFNFSYVDMAGNDADTISEEEFYVDTVAPEISVTGINYKSANSSSGNIGFKITSTDTNFDEDGFAPEFIKYELSGNDVNVSDMGTSEIISNGATYTVRNIKEDGVYAVSCTVTDKAGNTTKKSAIEDEKGNILDEEISIFSINREGSTFMITGSTKELVENGYVQNVDDDIVITEINPDNVNNYVVTLDYGENEKVLSASDNYTRTSQGSDSSWKTYEYTVKANNFEDECAYSLSLTTKDSAENTSYSNTNNPSYSDDPAAKIEFVVDRTIPQVVVNNLSSNGRYNVETQSVEIIAKDDNLLESVRIVLNDDILAEYNEEALAENNGEITIDIDSSQTLQNLKIEAVDAAGNSTDDPDDTSVHFDNFLVTTSFWIQFINNPIALVITGACLLLVVALIIFIVVKKRSKKEEKDS